jgi:Skp family chaperone for outer membrane proteins
VSKHPYILPEHSCKSSSQKPREATLISERDIQPISPSAILKQTALAHESIRPANLISMQKTLGNRAVGGFLKQLSSPRPIIQPKLTVNAPGDEYEQEADQVAYQVVEQINAPTSPQSTQSQPLQRQKEPEEDLKAKPSISDLQRSPLSPLVIQREAIPEEEELQAQSTIQRGEAIGGGEASTDFESAINCAGGGQPLDVGLQRSMGQAMGTDFSAVRVHTGVQSDVLNQAIQAKAFTTGQDVFFRLGAYQPGNRGGQELIAHELTHVVQQTGGVQMKPLTEQSVLQLKCAACEQEEEQLQRTLNVSLSPEIIQRSEVCDEDNENCSDAGELLPGGVEPIPEGNVPSTEGEEPIPEGNVPSTEGEEPIPEGNVPSTEGEEPGGRRVRDPQTGEYQSVPDVTPESPVPRGGTVCDPQTGECQSVPGGTGGRELCDTQTGECWSVPNESGKPVPGGREVCDEETGVCSSVPDVTPEKETQPCEISTSTVDCSAAEVTYWAAYGYVLTCSAAFLASGVGAAITGGGLAWPALVAGGFLAQAYIAAVAAGMAWQQCLDQKIAEQKANLDRARECNAPQPVIVQSQQDIQKSEAEKADCVQKVDELRRKQEEHEKRLNELEKQNKNKK